MDGMFSTRTIKYIVWFTSRIAMVAHIVGVT